MKNICVVALTMWSRKMNTKLPNYDFDVSVSEARTGQLLGLKDVPAVTYPLGSTSAIGECWRYAVGKHNLYVGKFWKFYFNLSVKVDQSSLPHFGKNYVR